MAKCYFSEPCCTNELWQCETCKEWYCSFHFHSTNKGFNVECAACELNRDEQEQHPESTYRTIRFYCPRCGKEMWEGVSPKATWEDLRHLLFESLNELLECSTCILDDIIRDREYEHN